MENVVLQSRLRSGLGRGAIVDSVRDGLRKADAEDLRFEDRVDRIVPPIESEPVPSSDVPSADTATVPGGDGGDAFDTSDFHHKANDEVGRDRADRIGADPDMEIDAIENGADVDFNELVKHRDLNMRRQADEVNHDIMQIVGTWRGNAIKYRR